MFHAFDKLRYEILWETDVYFDLFSCVSRLSVDAGEDGPEAWQRGVYDKFVSAQVELKPRLQEALLTHYRSIVDDYRERFGSECDRLVPFVSNFAELLEIISPEAVFIGLLEKEEWEVGLLYTCTWDSGHGLGVKVINGRIAEIGPQDVCL